MSDAKLSDLELAIRVAEKRLKEIARLEKRIAKLEKVINLVHWVDGYPGMEGRTGYCPWCNRDASEGDTPDCPRKAVVK